MENNEQKKSVAAAREEKVLEFWKENSVFEATLAKDSPKGEFVFYEGPPTANGKPGIHHLEARAFKDAIPRYKTMQGFHVRRKGGWDTHGLPVELQVEKALGLNSKKAIEEYGIAKFNQQCKESVWQYLGIWEEFTDRIGYWVDQKNPYVTYHNDYIESVWNVLKKVDEKGLVYKDYRIVPWCPRCGTALSSHELAQGYQEDKDLSVTAKFKIVGVENGYFLAWTTTPWTLPGNVALAVGNDIDYVEIKVGTEILVLAKSRLSIVTEPYKIVAEHKGSEMVGMQYEPLYPYMNALLPESQKENLTKAYKIYSADFVTTTDGTGIVHTAVMYGADDFELGTKLGLPKFHMVNPEGHFIAGTDFLESRFVKDEHVAVDIIKDLAHRGLLFKKEKFEHQYPHCWRCKTPLIYYARDSWYIRMSDPVIKGSLIEENKKINWEPEYIRDGRFGEWLKDIKDWAISRERYWGTPLPIWTTVSGTREFIGSIDALKARTKKSGNEYYIMRHGQATHNLSWSISTKADDPSGLTEEGKKQVLEAAETLKDKNIDLLVISPFVRTRETAEIVRQTLGLSSEQVLVDDRLHEFGVYSFEGKSWKDYHQKFPKTEEYFEAKEPGDESYADMKRRVMPVLEDAEKNYTKKNIVFITHGGPAWAMTAGAQAIPLSVMYAMVSRSDNPHLDDMRNAQIRKLEYVPLPHNENYELDLHRPYIDQIELISEGDPSTGSGREPMTRVKEVMDVWFDSGAMPFAQDHYPFENKAWVDGPGYPADFICEAIDQTRGWFYTLHAVGMLMGRGRAYKNVICLGHILDKEGKKMSKSLGNIVDPWDMIEKYGVDTLRLWMYSVNQPGESKNFDEKTVAELHNKVFNLLYNVLAFYELYRNRDQENNGTQKQESKNVLDKWILARLNQLIELSTKHIDQYQLLEPVRAMREFIDDLSTWYVRRSRDRMKDGDAEAKQTLYFVLKTMAKLLAPFAPFAAEDIWQKLKNEHDAVSVHLESWPVASLVDGAVLENMQSTRDVVTLGLEGRQKAKIAVRQPLAKITVQGAKDTNAIPDIAFLKIISEELNIKEVEWGFDIANKETVVVLDTAITPALKREGEYRELVRAIQDLRKKEGLTPSDTVILTLSENAKGVVEGFEADLKKIVLAKEIIFADNGGDAIEIAGATLMARVEK